MGIDWVVDLGCPTKEVLGTEGIVQMLKARSRAETVIQSARERGDLRSPEELELELVLLGPEGPRRQTQRVQDLIDMAAPLDQHAPKCAGCPANVSGSPYGCAGYINYPILRSSERWLLQQLPGDASSTAGTFLRRALADFGWDGSSTAEMRQRSEIFEARQAQSRTWDEAELTLTSDQLFEMLFGLGPLQPSHAMMMALFLGFLPHETPPTALGKLGRGEGQLLEVADGHRQSTREAGEPQVEALFSFVVGLLVSAGLGVAMLVDA